MSSGRGDGGGRTAVASRGRGRGRMGVRRPSVSEGAMDADDDNDHSPPPPPPSRPVLAARGPTSPTAASKPAALAAAPEASATQARAPVRRTARPSVKEGPEASDSSLESARSGTSSSASSAASAATSLASASISSMSLQSPGGGGAGSGTAALRVAAATSTLMRSNSGGVSNITLAVQVKGAAARLFPAAKEEEADALIVARLPRDTPAEAASLVRKLQDGLDDAVRQRRRLVEACAEIERQLLHDSADGRGERQHLAAQVDELGAAVASLRADKTSAVSSVEKRWRAKQDEDAARHRKEVDELRKKLETKEEESAQLLYVNMANERRIAELTTRASSASASAHVEGGDARRDQQEAQRLQREVNRLTSVLEAKSNEVSTAMITFAEMQRMTAERESELKAKLKASEGKIYDAEVKCEEARAELSASKQELTAAIADVNSLRDRLSDLRRANLQAGGMDKASYTEVADLKARLAVETSLKDRAEMREEAERRERVATNAQLVAVEQRWVKLMEEARLEYEARERKLVNERDEFGDRATSLAISSKELKESCERLEAEKRTLQRGFERLKSAGTMSRVAMASSRKDSDSYSEDDGENHLAGGDWASMNPIERELAAMARNASKSAEPEKVGLWGRIRGKGAAARKPDDFDSAHISKVDALAMLAAKERQAKQMVSAAQRRAHGSRASYGQTLGQHSPPQSSDGKKSPLSSSDRSDYPQAAEEAEGGGADASAAASAAVPLEGAGAEEGAGTRPRRGSLLSAEDKAKRDAERQEEREFREASAAAAASSAASMAEMASEMAELAGANEALKRRVADLERENKELREQVETTKAECKVELAELKEKVRDGEAKRRKMHNLIQELRGNVRVFARVRPFLPLDKESKMADPRPWLSVQADGASLDVLAEVAGSKPGKGGKPAQPEVSHSFSYDKAFSPSDGQDQVFEEVSEFVQSALDGFNVCLFSYGQTGSGKTHTMQGIGAGGMRGIIPRAVEQVASYKASLEEQGWVYTMKVSFIEIYCEKIRDLLRVKEKKGAAYDIDHKIVKNDYGSNEVTNVNTIEVDPGDKAAMAELMMVAASARATTKTDMNETSSRSHSVFTLHLSAENVKLNASIVGQLNLCDLAGSERVDRSGAQGQTLTEAKNINKSLSALAHVFESLSQRAAHVPFRDSTLTYLLEPSLSGNGKTLMIINLSPTQESVPESVSTLRFGAKVNKVELGKAKRQIDKIGATPKDFSKEGDKGDKEAGDKAKRK